MSDWYDKATKDELGNSGNFTGGPAKGVLHTTEGKSYKGARAAFVKNRSNPHFTVSFEKGFFEVWQHAPISKAARALRNASGGVETNRDHAIQIEIVGTCNTANRDSWGNQYVENFPVEYLDGIAELMRWIEANAGVQRLHFAIWKSYPDSYGENNGVRYSNSAWDGFSGWCGHQHVPENFHGDPGLIDINYLINGAQPVPQPEPTPAPQPTHVNSGYAKPVHVVLRQGSPNQEINGQHVVNHLQDLLGVIVDGNFGPKTKAAVVEHQRRFGLPQDGIVGPTTWAMLHGFMRYGDAGNIVAEIQTSITNVEIDGYFGNGTDQAVKEYQSSVGLNADGIVGPSTWATLLR